MADLRRQWLAAIAHLVTATEPPARLLALGRDTAALAMADGSLATIVIVADEPDVGLGTRLAKIVTDNPHAHLKHVLVGGEPTAMRALLRGCQPRLSMQRAVQVFHLSASGDVWAGPGGRRDSPVGRALTAATIDPHPPQEADIAALVRPPAPLSPEAHQHAERGQRFIDRIRGAKPRAVWGLLAAIAVVYALEVWWGGSELPPTLVRMGANTEASLTGQPWRLASSVLLHAGLAHAAINGFVLIALGGFLERLLGAARVLVLLVAAGIGGALASAVAGSAALSVGASGAIWGALGASAVLALRPSGAIPQAVVPSLRRAVIINLVINLTVSFLPQVDLWAHLGGGVTGAALVLSGVLVRGLPGVVRGSDVSDVPTSGRAMTLAAVLAALTLFSSTSVAYLVGEPWMLAGVPTSTVRPLGDGLVTARLPEYFPAASRFDHHGLDAYAVGDILSDPFTLVIVVEPHAMTTGEYQEAHDEVINADPPPPPEATVLRPWGPSDVGADAYEVRYAYDNGLRIQMWYQVQARARVRVDTTWWQDAPAPQLAAARQALESIAQ